MALNALREGAKSGIVKFLLMGFMTMAVAGLVLMDMGGFFRGGVQPTTVAEVNGSDLSTSSFDNIVRNVLARQGLDATTAYQLGFIHQILNSEINNALLAQETSNLGLQVGDDLLATQVARLIEPMITPEMSRKEALQRILMSQGMSEAQFVQALRSEISSTMLRNAVQLSGAYVPQTEALLLQQYVGEIRKIDALILPNATIRDYQEPTDEVLLPFYQAGQERFAQPETRTFTLATLTTESLEKTLDVSEEELKDLYEQEISAFQTPERLQMTQAVLADQAAAQAVADTASKKDTTLEEAVKKVTGTTDSYLGEDAFEEGGLVEEISREAFAAKTGDVVGPIETPLGWHVLVVGQRLAPETTPFADVRDQLKQEILHNRLADQMYMTSGAIDDALAGGTALEDVIANFDLESKEFGPVRTDGSTPDQREGLEGYEEDRGLILETAFELVEGETSPVFELADGSFAVVRVETITPKTYTPFEDVKPDLARIWIADQQDVLNRKRTSDSLQALASGDKTLEDLANEFNGELLSFTLTRSGDLPKGITDAARTTFFTTDKGEYAMSRAENGYVLGHVNDVSIPDPDSLDQASIDALKEESKTQLQREYYIAYLQWLRQENDVKINENILQSIYGPGNEQF